MRVLCFGALNLDHTYQVERFPRPGETISAAGYAVHAGGKGLNQAIALARAGAEAHMAGCVGPDGGRLLDLLRADGVQTDCVEETALPTGHAVIQVDGGGQNCILIFPGANGAVSREQAGRTLARFSAGDGAVLRQAAFPVTAVDTTGAGDTYLGYFLATYLQTGSPEAALERAARAAAVAVTRMGAAEAIPRAEELV